MAERGRSGIGRSGKKRPSASGRPTGKSARRTDGPAPTSDPTATEAGPTLAEAREQLDATNEILQVIARSPADLDSVLRAVARNAARLCGADDALIYRIESDRLRFAVSHGPIPNALTEGPVNRDWVTGRSVVDRQTIHIPDLALVSEGDYPIAKAMQHEHGHRTTLATPLLASDRPLGVILIRRMEVKPFTDAQIKLLETFANQAVIAIENARTVSELEVRNKELDDALEQQNAMAELLQAISSARGDLQPVFETLLRNAIRLCSAEFGVLFLHEDGEFNVAAMHGATGTFREFLTAGPHHMGNATATGRAVLTGKPVQIDDLKALEDPSNVETRKATVELGGGRTIFSVPMMQESRAIGAITIYRREVRPFEDKQIQLVSNFANHAVIAVENARLLNDLRDSLRQQTATADVLKTISSTAFDLDAVLGTLLRSALDLCGAFAGSFLVREGDAFVDAVQIGWPEAFDDLVRGRSSRAGTGSVGQRVALTGEIVHVHDVLSDPDYEYKDAQKLGGYRTVLGAPLIRDGDVIGILMLARNEVRPFAENEIRLVETFCDQAVIAFQNSRLLQELQDRNDDLSEALDQQTATAEILRAISTSPTDTQPVFDAIARHAATLCRARFCFVHRFDGELLHFVAHHGIDRKAVEIVNQSFPVSPGMGSVSQRSVQERAIVQIADVLSDPEYGWTDLSEHIQYRSNIGVPMMRGDQAIGTIVVARTETGLFPERQVELLKTFAEQAVIAIENVRLFTELEARNRDLAETLEQQRATSEILAVISSSPTDAQPVFDTIVRNAVSLCGCLFANVFRYDGEWLHYLASCNVQPGYREMLDETYPMRPDATQVSGRTILAQSVIRMEDALADPDYDQRYPTAAGWRRMLGVPMMRDGIPIGALVLGWAEPGHIDETQVKLIQTFAEQAVIAIENVRLFTELQTRLMHEAATREILYAISRSRGDYRPVFDMILKNAGRLCDAPLAFLSLVNEERTCLDLVGHRGDISQGFLEILTDNPLPLDPDVAETARAVIEKQVVQIEDLRDSKLYAEGQPHRLRSVDVEGMRTLLVVPLISGDDGIGALCLWRRETKPFDHASIELVKTFAEQAVIAVENVKQFNALETRLERETATAAILEVISQSRADEKPVFDVILESASRLCDAPMAFMMMCNEERTYMNLPAHRGSGAEFVEMYEKNPQPFDPKISSIAQAIQEMKTVQMLDLADHRLYRERQEHRVAAVELEGIRTILAVPLISRGQGVGAICLYRREIKAFDDDQIDLVKTFAEQAVIAIENVRLFTELNETLQRQTATADVLKTISRSTFDLETVLQTLVESAVQLCRADQGTIARKKDGTFHRTVNVGLSPEFEKIVRDQPVELQRGTATGRALLNGEIVHIPDVELDPEYTFLEARRMGGMRTILAVPMLREGEAIGVFVVTRTRVEPFSEEQIELVSTFADQAAIAIENVRLFENAETRSRELANSLSELRTAQDRLVQTEKLASLGQLTAGIAHEIKNPMNFVNNFASVSVELIDEMLEEIGNAALDGEARAAIDEIAQMLSGNLSKISEHGRRADSIVKNMLMHARQGSSDHRSVDINLLVEESLNLAYHGARAEKQGFTIELERDLDPQAGVADVYPQEITRVLLNLISNGFYSAVKRAEESGTEPSLSVATRDRGDRIEIRVRDNGYGIDDDTKKKLFSPFFTTKPVGEGTGLGLSISHDIIVKQHGGSITVESAYGEFCEFTIVIPRSPGFGSGAAR